MCSRRGERTSAEILEAGREVLLERGLDGLSLREVARRADISPSGVYNHFRNKDELVVALAMQSVATLAGYMTAVPAGPAPERLMSLGTAYAAFADECPAEYRVIFDCLANPPREWASYIEVAHPFSLIVSTCAQGLDDKSLVDRDGLDAGGMAYALWCLVDGHVHLRSKHLAAVDGPYPQMFDSAMNALIAGYLPTTKKGRS